MGIADKEIREYVIDNWESWFISFQSKEEEQ